MRKTPNSILIFAILYFLLFCAISILLYTQYAYTGYDLGIFNQVLWNSTRGALFEYSFGPHSYLVDHRAWALLGFIPIYALFQHPITLLIFQSAILALGGIVLYQLATHIFSSIKKPWKTRLSIGVTLLYYIHPTIQGINLFEFHLLPIVIPLTFLLWRMVLQNRFLLFGIIAGLLLLVREDLSLMLIGLSLLLLYEKRSERKWVYASGGLLLLSIGWFTAMTAIGSALAPAGTAKFLVFYEPFGDTPSNIIQNILLHPLHSIQVIFGKDHSIALGVLLLSFACIPLVKAKYLLPAIVPLTIYLLIDRNLFEALVYSHYSALILPWFFIGFMYGIVRLWKSRIPQDVLLLVFIICPLVVSIAYGQWPELIKEVNEFYEGRSALYRNATSLVQNKDSVMTTAGLYPHLSSREQLYPAMLLFAGTQHYSTEPYIAPERVDWIILEQDTIVTNALKYPDDAVADIPERLQQVIDANNLQLHTLNQEIVAYGKKGSVDAPVRTQLEPLTNSVDIAITDTLTIAGWEIDGKILRIAFTGSTKPSEDDLHVQLPWNNEFISIGNGVSPTSTWGTIQEYQIVSVPLGLREDQLGENEKTVRIGPLEVISKQWPIYSEQFILSAERSVDLPLQ